MSKNKKQDDIDDAVEFVDHLTNFIADSSNQSDDELRQELKSLGINVENLIDKTTSIVAKAQESERLSWMETAKIKRMESIKKRKKPLTDFTLMNMEKLLKYFNEICTHDLSFAHRNLNSSTLSEDELRSILHEYEVLKKIDGENNE